MIKVQNLTKKYSDLIALNNVSFELNKGEIIGLIGTNGAGKSTTVKILSGLLEYDSGKVDIMGIDVMKEPVEVKKIIGYVPESPNLFNSLTVTEYLNFIGEIRLLDKTLLKKRIDNFAGFFSFEQYLNESIGILSKGNKQKVLITSALLHNPEIIYFDEPLNGLDANAIFAFQDLVDYLRKENKIILYCSHLLSTIEKISTRIIYLDKGVIRIDKPNEELKNSENYTDLENMFREISIAEEVNKFKASDLF
ncbi:MAG: ABC transporter ATP-binding protein [Ignavibacteria bacterium]|nr:ABC transporter ATP-binding protein [Ignavibacteria bacterium]